MNRRIASPLIILIVGGLSYFTALGSTWLWDEDEAFFATAALEMHRQDEWIVPTFNEELFAHKPPFMYWMMRCGFLMFGPNELGARFFSAVFGIATALVTYHIGRRLYDDRAGLWAALALTTCLMWSVVSRASTADAYLGFFISLSLLVYLRAVMPAGGAACEASAPDTTLEETLARWIPGQWSTMAAIYGLMGMAVLVKGPIGVLLPGATIGLFILCRIPVAAKGDGRLVSRLFLRAVAMTKAFPIVFWRLRPLTAIMAVLLIAGPWFVAVAVKTDGAFVREFFGVHNFGRFLKPMENHRGPVFYYLPVIAIGFFPWSIFAMPTALSALRRAARRPADLFLLCWSCWMVGFFSIASTKLPNYVLPAYPAIALLTAGWLSAWVARRDELSPSWPGLAFSTLTAVGVLLLTALPGVATLRIGEPTLLERFGVNSVLTPEVARLWWLGIAPMVGGVLALLLGRRDQREAAVWSTSIASAAFTATVLIGAAGELNPFQTSAPLTAAIQSAEELDNSETLIGSFRHSPPSLIFYSGTHVERMGSVAEAARFLASDNRRYLVTTDSGLQQLRDAGQVGYCIVDRRPRFPRRGEVLVVCNQSSPGAVVQQASAESPAPK